MISSTARFVRISMILVLLAASWACGGQGANVSAPVSDSPFPLPSVATLSAGTVEIRSAHGLILVGTLLPAAQPNSPGLLLLHQWQSDRHSYDEFAHRMQARGFNVLAIDGRGFGESTKSADGKTVAAERTGAAVKAMLSDVDAAMKFLADQPNVDKTKIGIVGASYGGSLALIYAADHPTVAAVALLSPGLNYFGNMPTEPAVEKYSDGRPFRPLFFVAAEDDKESADAVRKLDPRIDNPRYPSHVFTTGGHGTALLKVGADEDLSDFFADAFELANLHLRP